MPTKGQVSGKGLNFILRVKKKKKKPKQTNKKIKATKQTKIQTDGTHG